MLKRSRKNLPKLARQQNSSSSWCFQNRKKRHVLRTCLFFRASRPIVAGCPFRHETPFGLNGSHTVSAMLPVAAMLLESQRMHDEVTIVFNCPRVLTMFARTQQLATVFFRYRSVFFRYCSLVLILLATHRSALQANESRYHPDWADIPPIRKIRHTNTNGDSLVKAVAALQPGDQLVVSAGTYLINPMWDIKISGTAEAPVWIVAEEGAQVVLTRPDAKQNVLNIGQGGPVKFLCLRGLEITGGSHGMRLGHCSEIWIDRCHIHHTGNVCLSANSANCSRLFLTRNHFTMEEAMVKVCIWVRTKRNSS